MEWLHFEGNPRGVNVAVFAVCTVVVWLAGWRLSQYADRFASASGIARRRRYEMALADIFGTNLFNILLVFVADLVYQGGPALNEVGRFSLVASLLGALLAAVYLVGLIERRDKTIARMGVDSLAVMLLYLAGLAVLYRLR